jgi:hypothetical protein
MKPLPSMMCQTLFNEALDQVDYDIYDLRWIKKQPDEDEVTLFSKNLISKKKNYRIGKVIVNGIERTYTRDLSPFMGMSSLYKGFI